MNLEKLVTSFDLSKRLKSAGVEQSANYWWSDEGNLMYEMAGRLPNINYKSYHYSAFLAEEILAIIRQTKYPGLAASRQGIRISTVIYHALTIPAGDIRHEWTNTEIWDVASKGYSECHPSLAEAAGEVLLNIKEGWK